MNIHAVQGSNMSASHENRYAPEPLAARLQLKLERLSKWHALDVRCTNCGHAGYITISTLSRYYSRHMKVADTEHRFKCRRCGLRGHVEWTLVKQRR